MLSGFLLYIRSVDINDREIIHVDGFDDGFDIFTNFIVILFEIVGDDILGVPKHKHHICKKIFFATSNYHKMVNNIPTATKILPICQQFV